MLNSLILEVRPKKVGLIVLGIILLYPSKAQFLSQKDPRSVAENNPSKLVMNYTIRKSIKFEEFLITTKQM